MTFLGIAWLQRRKGHVVVDVVVTRMKPLPQSIFRMANIMLGIVVSLGLTVFGAKATWDSFQEGMRIWGVLFPPEWIVLIIIPMGSFLLLLEFLRDAYEAFTGRWKPYHEEEEEELISLV
jgi:TRAP-type C4-dicarboxylate transport system permease small subunit